ncbi:U-scoloptoxin(01)-Cw1a-like, partial [Pollicipes pollicipes]|uniref:U-scoloptoxin(01)-Cw1a-like n=1 Tax=Pollicipes pollicipes TaxID=41117 RepID=UPI0018859CFF
MSSYVALLYVLGCVVAAASGATLEETLPGVPGQDYPIYAEVPDTGFACDGRINGGYYADPQAQCQVFHVCSNDLRYSFLCPNGTVFSQIYFVC